MMTATEIASLKSLREFSSADHHPVVSLYLDIDGARFPTRADYEAELSFLVHEARRAAGEKLQLSEDQKHWLDAELQAISEYLAFEFSRDGARSLVIYSCRPENLWQPMTLALPVENHLFVDWKPHVAPLNQMLTQHSRYCVLVASKEKARIFEVYLGEAIEHSDVLDSVLKRHEQGGWEQAKFQRRHELLVHNHLKKAVAATLELFQSKPFDLVAIGIADELWPELERVLHPYLQQRLAFRFNTDINAGADEIMARVMAIDDNRHQREEKAMLESLGPELNAGQTYVGGIDSVLASLNERRVELLLVENGYSLPGKRCYACDMVTHEEESCLSCNTAMEAVPDVVQEAMELAVRQDATVIGIEPGSPAMAQANRIAARLRY